MSWRSLLEIIMAFVILGLVLITINLCSRKTEPEVIETNTIIRDTIVSYDTIEIIKPAPVVVKHTHDTIILIDTVFQKIPVVTALYEDSLYSCQVSGGAFARLDSIRIYPKTNTIYVEKTNTIKQKPILTVSAGVGVGWNASNNHIDPIIGLSIGFPIWNLYRKK